jgi:UDP-2,3-diacylglucosamine pyrophosphatase LpxH
MNNDLDPNKPLLFLGDHHGEWGAVFNIIYSKNISDCHIICVGDGGEGFITKTAQLEQFENLNQLFKQRNIEYKSIRGNHSDPYFFQNPGLVTLSNFQLVEDYSLFSYKNKTIQLIGGAISIDREGRAINVSYWENENVIFAREKLRKVDILVTHTAPSQCFPQQFNEIVYGWAREDAYLIEDLNEERSLMDEIFKICQPSFHVYGHFHSSWSEEINGCRHRLLDINEIYEYRDI